MAGEGVVWVGFREFDLAMDSIMTASSAASREIAVKGGDILVRSIRAHMHGRPGPNVRTGLLEGSVRTRVVRQVAPGVWESETSPATPYAMRIELGFHGADSLGRVYNQGPYPYMRPGIVDAFPLIEALEVSTWGTAIMAA